MVLLIQGPAASAQRKQQSSRKPGQSDSSPILCHSLRTHGGILPGSTLRVVSLPSRTKSCSELKALERADERMWQEEDPVRDPPFLGGKTHPPQMRLERVETVPKSSCGSQGDKGAWLPCACFESSKENLSAGNKSSILPTPMLQLIYSQQLSPCAQKIRYPTGNEKNIHFFQEEGRGIIHPCKTGNQLIRVQERSSSGK